MPHVANESDEKCDLFNFSQVYLYLFFAELTKTSRSCVKRDLITTTNTWQRKIRWLKVTCTVSRQSGPILTICTPNFT